jgi:hypothetical protein
MVLMSPVAYVECGTWRVRDDLMRGRSLRRSGRTGAPCSVADADDDYAGTGEFVTNNSELKNQNLVVGAWRFELQTSCVQRSCKESILLVRLALFCVMVHGFGPDLAVFGPKLDPSFWRARPCCAR